MTNVLQAAIGLGMGWTVGFIAAAVISFALSVVVKGIGKLIKLTGALPRNRDAAKGNGATDEVQR